MTSIEMVRGDEVLWAEHEGGDEWFVRRNREEPTKCTSGLLAVDACEFFKGGCDRFCLHLEDTILVLPPKDTPMRVEDLVLRSFSCITGAHYSAWPTSDQVLAILTLAIGGDNGREDLYETLEPLLAHWPAACRPVP